MTLSDLCLAHWPAIKTVTRDPDLLTLRLAKHCSAAPRQPLAVWAHDHLLPALRSLPDLPGPDRVSDPVLLASGLMAYLAGRTTSPTVPQANLLALWERHLFDPKTLDVLPVKRPAQAENHPVEDDGLPEVPAWVPDLVERLVALGCGWHRTSVAFQSNPVVSETKPSLIAVACGWEDLWPTAIQEMVHLAVPLVEQSLKALFNQSPGVGHHLREKWFGTQDPRSRDWAEKMAESTVLMVLGFTASCPDPTIQKNCFLYLEFWEPTGSSLALWVKTMLRGSVHREIQIKSFADGWIFQTLTSDYRRWQKGKEAQKRLEDETDGKTKPLPATSRQKLEEVVEASGGPIGIDASSILHLAVKEVAVRHCLNPDCESRDLPRPAFETECPACAPPFAEVYFSIPGIVVTEDGWNFHEEKDFIKCQVESVFDDPVTLEKMEAVKRSILGHLKDLLTNQQEPARWCDTASMANALGLSPTKAESQLMALERDGHVRSKRGEAADKAEAKSPQRPIQYKLKISPHYVRWPDEPDPDWVAVLNELKMRKKAASAAGQKRDPGRTLTELAETLTLSIERTEAVLESLVKQGFAGKVSAKNKAPDVRFRLGTRGATVYPRLFQPHCPLHPHLHRFSQRPTLLWMQCPDDSKVSKVPFLDPSPKHMDEIAAPEEEEDGDDADSDQESDSEYYIDEHEN